MTKFDHSIVQKILMKEDEGKYLDLCKYLVECFGFSGIQIERIYLSHGNYSSLAITGSLLPVEICRNFKISALGHPNLGKLRVCSDTFSRSIEEEIEFICLLLSKQFQVDWMKNLMHVLAVPLPWQDEAPVYLKSLAAVCRKAAAAAHIAIRELKDDRIEVAAWHSVNTSAKIEDAFQIPASSPAGKLMCPPKEDDRIHFHNEKSELVLFMREKLDLPEIDAIITMPIIVQGERIGAVNYAYDHEFEFSPTFRTGLELLSNVIGTALNNYRLSNQIELNARKIFWSGRQALNYELMQGYRHWANSAVFELDSGLKHVLRIAEKDPDKTSGFKTKIVDSRRELNLALEGMEALTSSYKLKKTKTSLRRAFFSSTDMLRRDLDKEGIRIVASSVEDSLEGNEDALRAAFLNLVLNSIQAIRSERVPDGRIELSLVTERDRVNFTYSDNGPGLKFSGKLGRHISKPESIWLPEITTKNNGTGFGMPMVRQVIRHMHRGDIYLNTQLGNRGFSVKGYVSRYGFDEGNWGEE